MDNPLDPRIPRAALSPWPAALPPLSETPCVLKGIHWSRITDQWHRRTCQGCVSGVGSKGKSERGRVASIGEKFQELRLAQHKAEAQVDLRGEMLRDVSIWQRRIDFELGLMAEIIFTESTAEERTHMPAEWHEQPVQLFKWAVGEAKSRDKLQRRRWACIIGEVSCPPSPPAMQ